jgi:hypothetical protein
MERIVCVLFDEEIGARAGLRALGALDREGAIAVYAAMIVQKGPQGIREVLAPAGAVAPLTTAGLRRFIRAIDEERASGEALEAERIDVDVEFLGHVYAMFASGMAALIADVEEERVTPIDSRMEPLRGLVLRCARSGLPAAALAQRLTVIDADITQLDVERVHAEPARKEKLERAARELLQRRGRMVLEVSKRQEADREEAAEKVKLLMRKAASGGAAAAHHCERMVLIARAHGLPLQ